MSSAASKWLLPTHGSLCFSQNLLLIEAFISTVMDELDIVYLFGNQMVWFSLSKSL